MTFRRGLGEPFLKLLDRENWWNDVKKHEDLAIAIRNEYLNVYSNGQSVLKVISSNGSLAAKVHHKYLLNEAEPEYRTFERGIFDTAGLNYIQEYQGNDTLERLINNANVYGSNEKECVHKIIRNDSNSNIIDLEVTLTTLQESGTEVEAEMEAEKETEKAGMHRIDIAALEENPDGLISVVFYEVKTFSDPRLRARNVPEVLVQLENYGDAIEKNQNDIKQAYGKVCSNLLCLDRPVGKPGKMSPLIERVAREKDTLKINCQPRLIIVDYSGDQLNGGDWQPHWKKLDQLGRDRVIGWGNPARVTIGPERLNGGRRYRSN